MNRENPESSAPPTEPPRERAEPRGPVVRRVVLMALATLLMGGLYLRNQVTVPLRGLHGNDFHHLYLGAKILRLGESPYDRTLMKQAAAHARVSVNPYVYLPFTGQVMAPLTFLPMPAAQKVWFWANHVFLLAALGLMAWGRGRWSPAAFLMLLGMASCWYPLTRTLTAGQLNCALLLLITAYWRAMVSGRGRLAGFTLAFAALLKIAPGFLILLAVLQRRWRLLRWTIGWGLGLTILSAVACGPGRYVEFLSTLRQMGYGKSTWSAEGFDFYRQPFNQSPNAFFHRALTDNPTTEPWVVAGPSVANGLTRAFAGLLLLAGATLILRSRKDRAGDDLDLAIALIIMFLLPSLYWDHYGVLLLLPVALIARRRPTGWPLAALVGGVILVAVPQGLFHSLSSGRGPGVLLYSMGLWGTLAILAAAAALRLRWTAECPTRNKE